MSGAEQEGSYPLKPSSPVKRLAVVSSASEPSPKKRLISTAMPYSLGPQTYMVNAGWAEGAKKDQFDQDKQVCWGLVSSLTRHDGVQRLIIFSNAGTTITNLLDTPTISISRTLLCLRHVCNRHVPSNEHN
jgi:hypothetical protein